jgi:2-polyprenyl-3-methyl-5-hydroxy-6-metoxy-1,4-benzoquinol methylase
MTIKADVVVLSEAPKDLGPGVEVVVGLPAKNPWSLPFAHKAIFAKRIDHYDLFAYSEDDIEITEANIQAFLHATPQLEQEEIAGFLRYEIDAAGARALPDVLGGCHWKAESVRRRGGYTIAEFTNEHAAFYLLTRSQLKRAIASGGFLREPYEGRYDMLCSAATDPYTSCGFRKVICVSALDEFLIHHMSNRYVGEVGLPLASFKEQVKTLGEILEGIHPASTLGNVEPKVLQRIWSKGYYEKPSRELLRAVPEEAKTILSVGCGWGAVEVELEQRGAQVTAVPLDSVIGAAAARRGLSVIYGTWGKCLRVLGERRFDSVLITRLLHLQPNPAQALEQYSRLVRKHGTLVLSGPNFERIPIWFKRFFGNGDYRRLHSFDVSGISVCGPRILARHLKEAGLRMTAVQWINHAMPGKRLAGAQLRLGRLTAQDWILQARR